ncbi:sugar permease [Limosilactobacillus sp. STM2_1]|uniref:Sugar permease n=1 Tax=Limosilactobacillus rudii TaxID=2759755 RepID=A0A7W3YMN0_9LACO|nr:sugar permease [Limosilactobacillus rudii]MBB1079588.1 sugar permease [Limosilactobacillus rudii]MBB1097634.1 sugar permease [Limosilactobacillus rudii]MCD7134743.1 sugar permease [Limosilactobacillus rudii]
MRRYGFLALAIILNSIGHSLTIVTNLGSMPWPASIVNIMQMMNWNMTETIFTEGLFVIGLNILLVGAFVPQEFGWEMIFLIPYSILMQLFANLWRLWGIDTSHLSWRFSFDILGLIIAFAGYALYQQCDCCYHPHDKLTVFLKRRVNVKFTKYFNIVLPVIIILLCSLKNHMIYAFNVGTLIGYLSQRRIVGFWQEKVLINIKFLN